MVKRKPVIFLVSLLQRIPRTQVREALINPGYKAVKLYLTHVFRKSSDVSPGLFTSIKSIPYAGIHGRESVELQ